MQGFSAPIKFVPQANLSSGVCRHAPALPRARGQSIQSFDQPEADWLALRLESRRSRQLRLPCCDASVVMKTSTRGLKFFAHKSRGPCQSAPETEAHLGLKTLATRAARRAILANQLTLAIIPSRPSRPAGSTPRSLLSVLSVARPRKKYGKFFEGRKPCPISHQRQRLELGR